MFRVRSGTDMGSDTLLLEKYVRSRDVEAFAALAHRYEGMVYGTSLRVLRNSHDAEEIAQECFLSLARKPHSVRSSLPGWLHRMALNKAKNFLKSEQRRKRRERSAARQETRVTPEPSWDDIAPLVDQAIADLPDELREPVIAHFLQKQSHAEVAKSLNVNRSTITRRIQAGIEALRVRFGASGVTLSVAILTTILYEKSVCAAPASLTATIGKMALAGVSGATKTGAAAGTAATGAKATAGGIAMKLAIPVVIVAAVVGGGIVLHNVTAQQQPPPTPQAPIASVQQQPPVSPQTPVSAQPPVSVQPPAPPDAPKETMFAKGTVTDEAGNPVADAIVYATRSAEGGYAVEFETRTDANGRFAFEGLTPSEHYSYHLNYIFYANKPGFAWGDDLLHIDRASGGQTPLPLPAGVSDMEIPLSEPGSLAGRILTKAGQPVPDAVVFPCSGRASFPTGSKNLPFLSAITDEEGKFRIDNLPLGQKCGLQVEAVGFATIHPGRYIEERPNHLPLLTVGDETTEIRLAPESRIAGRVVYEKDGAPVAGVTVSGAETDRSFTHASASTAADGSFLLKGGLAAGHYRLTLWQSGTIPSKRIPGWLMPRTYVDVAEGQALEGVVIKILDSVPVAARVLDKRTGEPVPAGSVWVKARGERGWSSGPQFAQSGCTLPLEPKQDYQLTVHADGYERWESDFITTDQGEMKLPDILLEPRETPEPTPRSPTRWRLLVVDEADRPVPEATVRLMSQPVGITGPDGRVQYQIPPTHGKETSRVLIWEPVRKLVATYAPQPIPKGEKPAEVRVVLHKPGTIVGTVKDTLGRPVRNDYVGYGRGELWSTPTDETGRYVIHNVPPGKEEIRLYTRYEGYGYGHGWVREVNPGQTVTVPDIVLPIADQIITGRVTDTEGKPVGHAPMTVRGRATPFHHTVSDADGRFTLKGIVLEDVRVDVEADGFAPLEMPLHAGEFKDLELRLRK